MAIPKSLKEITEKSAHTIISSHPEGHWDGMVMNSDFIYEGRLVRGYRRSEMVRVTTLCGKTIFEHGVCCC